MCFVVKFKYVLNISIYYFYRDTLDKQESFSVSVKWSHVEGLMPLVRLCTHQWLSYLTEHYILQVKCFGEHSGFHILLNIYSIGRNALAVMFGCSRGKILILQGTYLWCSYLPNSIFYRSKAVMNISVILIFI